jgi:hypothetical protein
MCHVSNGWTGKTGGMLNGAYLDSFGRGVLVVDDDYTLVDFFVIVFGWL